MEHIIDIVKGQGMLFCNIPKVLTIFMTGSLLLCWSLLDIVKARRMSFDQNETLIQVKGRQGCHW